MKESKLFKCLVVTFVAIVIGGPAVALASTHDYYEVKTTVSYADLNLENEESVRVLYRRLQRASSEVCTARSLKVPGSLPRLLEQSTKRETRQCKREALSNAVEKFDNEILTRIHAR
ncbi:MAG: UrcA family protein [Proteobacteria bacterium]|nr:UrcA family protein [Pseudomonadota bacterium]